MRTITEVASFSESPVSWIIWSANLACVLTVIGVGSALVIKRKALFLFPLIAGIAATHGLHWMTASRSGVYPVPKVVRTLENVDDPAGQVPVISTSMPVDVIAWGAALTVVFAGVVERKRTSREKR